MPQFCWPEVKNDIYLAREVVGQRPSKLSEWEEIAAVLAASFSIILQGFSLGKS